MSEENVSNVIFSNTKMVCENGKAYAGWTTVMEMVDGTDHVCAMFNTIISFTDHPTEIHYKLLDISEGKRVECPTES